MRLIASLVVQNEEHRYLQSFLEWNSQWWDGLFVYDGGSSDNTVKLCSRYADVLVSRPEDIPTFLDHEGQYRSAAFAAMADRMSLKKDDWIFSIDADEFLVGTTKLNNVRADLNLLINAAISINKTSVDIPIPEVWNISGPSIDIRIDGYWNKMSLPRLFQFRDDWDNGKNGFRDKAMGCGSGPQYTYSNILRNIMAVRLLHFGYAFQEDKESKSKRYKSLKNHGHNPKHIDSILQSPTLSRWDGVVPKWYRGTTVN